VALCAVSVDLDEIPNYYAIHGLPEPRGPARTLVYDVALGRLTRLARHLEIPLTLFAIGSDLGRPEAAAGLRAAHEAGAEIANHSLDHRYDLTRLGRAEIRRQVEQGAQAIERAVGTAPVGFRAPGYTITDEVFEILTDLGVAYDSSVFPCTPALGTYLTLYGSGMARRLARAFAGQPLVNLELHGIDVLDAADGLEDLRPHQPDVRVPREEKLGALRAMVDELRNLGHEFVTLKEAAGRVAG
jgi:peptidoglycan/xylan/chitin deacetylase (PgdA/CDA1 family)